MTSPTSRRRFPILPSLAGYRAAWLAGDVSAGLAVAAVALPVAIAYPAIAGLPPETGLYASIAPMIAYAFFGPSRQLMVGPDAATVTVLAAVLASILAGMPELTQTDRAAAAALIAIGVGVICLIARALGLGALASFLSRPILVGFFAGISLSIITGQIGRVTGLSIEAKGLLPPFAEMLAEAGSIHWLSVTLAVGMFAVLQAARILRSPVPGPVIVVVLAIALSAILGLEGRGVAVVGDLPSSLPALGLPSLAALPLDQIVLGAAAVFVVAFGSGIITARSFAARSGGDIDPDAELVGFGAANFASGLVGGFPVTAADSRTAVNLSVGGRSQVAGLAAALALTGALLYFGPLLRILPIPALGAILVAAAIGMIDLDSLRQIRRISRIEFTFALIALAGAVSFGVLQGVVVAIVASLAYVLHKNMNPRVVMLGRIPGRTGFYKLHRHEAARPVPGLAIVFVQGSLLFFNVDSFKARLKELSQDGGLEGLRWVVLDASAIAGVDSTSAAALQDMRDALAARGVRLALAELNAEVRLLLDRAGLIDQIGADMIFDDLEDALRAFEARPKGEETP